jgi:carbamoylphosphate synthase large subunit
VNLPKVFPYVIKTSHGLSGEGTYLIRSETDLENCRKEFRAYWGLQLVEAVVVSDFVNDVVDNYCVQFYVNKKGEVTVLGATHQLVSDQGVYLGGLIHYEHTNLKQFEMIINHTAAFAHQHGYFGVIGVDVLEDKDGKLHVIDANIRINGSTPMCLQKHDLMKRGKETAKYAGNWVMEGTEAEVIEKLKEHLKRRDFTILSALYYPETRSTAMYGIVAGENYEDMLIIEKQMGKLGLRQIG